MHSIKFHPKDGLKAPWEFIQATIPKLRDRDHVIEIKECSRGRSNTINGYYWAIVIPAFMAEMGVSDSQSGRDYMHYDVLGQELRQVADPHRPGFTMTKQTSTMTGSEFWKYLNQCNHLFYEFYNYTYPSPVNAGYDPGMWER